MTHQAAHQGQPAEGVTFIETALAGTRGWATPALLAELHIRQALAFGALRDTSACTAAISRARTQVEQLTSNDDPPWLYWLGPATIALDGGNSHLLLGRADQAAALLEEGIAQLIEPFIRDRQIHLTQRAGLLALPGKKRDLDAAASLGMQSIDPAESLNSTRGAGLRRDVYYQLTPHAKVPAVHDFLERRALWRAGDGNIIQNSEVCAGCRPAAHRRQRPSL